MPRKTLFYISAAFPALRLANAKRGLEALLPDESIGSRNELLNAALRVAEAACPPDQRFFDEADAAAYLSAEGLSFTRRRKEITSHEVDQELLVKAAEQAKKFQLAQSASGSEPSFIASADGIKTALAGLDFAQYENPVDVAKQYITLGETDLSELIRLITRDLPDSLQRIEEWKPALIELLSKTGEKQ